MECEWPVCMQSIYVYVTEREGGPRCTEEADDMGSASNDAPLLEAISALQTIHLKTVAVASPPGKWADRQAALASDSSGEG